MKEVSEIIHRFFILLELERQFYLYFVKLKISRLSFVIITGIDIQNFPIE